MSKPIAKFYWDEDTISHFQFISSYESKEKVIEKITNFVDFECELMGDETEEDLIEDLTNQIFY